jgi:hypothetical protein
MKVASFKSCQYDRWEPVESCGLSRISLRSVLSELVYCHAATRTPFPLIRPFFLDVFLDVPEH